MSAWITISDNLFYSSSSTFYALDNAKASCLLVVMNATCFIHVSVTRSVFTNNYVPIVAIHDLSMLVSYEIEIQNSNFTNSLERYPLVPNTAAFMYISTSQAEQRRTHVYLVTKL